ncbi:otolin-1-A [Centropristis striata]|uniref:otolin-1-A n=1 Tax=Centropristis striata TaxID=184440 RepID=UPI0027E0006A|nr:otolin-1-A [Centropristis striata]
MCIFVCKLIFLLFVYKASMCVNYTLAVCALMGPGIISHITKNKVLPCIQPALFHIPQESCNLFLPAHLPHNNPRCSVPCSLFGLPGQYKEDGSLHESVVRWDGVNTIYISSVLCQALSMPSIRLVFLTTLLVVLMAVLTSSARTTRWPKPQTTKKPPRGGGGFGRTTTTTTSSNMHTDETTEVTMDAYSLSPTDSTTYSSDTYPTDFHTDAIVPPGNTLGNYTLDYNECFFNFCECCPPEKGPVGPMGERGPPGPQGERGSIGLPGEKGEIGPRGPPGPAGLPGANGLNGDIGDKGDQGPVGLPGAPGIPGKPGEKGDPGLRGEKGERGFSGLKGDPGERGEPGLNGTKGNIGREGPMGPPGVAGTKGQKGEQGLTGECLPGEKGDVGERGPPGMRGVNGTDGAKGDPGPPGVKGDTGARGPPGLPGIRGIAGMRGERGAKGGRGPRGPKGPPGENVELIRSAFSVGLFPSRSFPPPSLPVKFDKVFYNGEGHWDPNLNKFNVTYSGVYLFSYHITVRNRPVRAALVVNGVRKLRTRDSLYGQDIDQASNLALMHLIVGDQVWLETLRDWNGVYSSSEDDSTFSGFLLYPDPKDKPTAIENV